MFGSQHPHEAHTTSAIVDPMSFLASVGIRRAHDAQTDIQAKHSDTF